MFTSIPWYWTIFVSEIVVAVRLAISSFIVTFLICQYWNNYTFLFSSSFCVFFYIIPSYLDRLLKSIMAFPKWITDCVFIRLDGRLYEACSNIFETYHRFLEYFNMSNNLTYKEYENDQISTYTIQDIPQICTKLMNIMIIRTA